jgi:hypothetical protein
VFHVQFYIVQRTQFSFSGKVTSPYLRGSSSDRTRELLSALIRPNARGDRILARFRPPRRHVRSSRGAAKISDGMPKQRQTCTRCSQRRQKCDRSKTGKAPCSRCMQNNEGHLCTTIWAGGYDPSVHRKYPRKTSPTNSWPVGSGSTSSLSTPPALPTVGQLKLPALTPGMFDCYVLSHFKDSVRISSTPASRASSIY